MDQETLFKLLQTFDASTIREMDLDFEDTHVYLNKNTATASAPAKTVSAPTDPTPDTTPLPADGSATAQGPVAKTNEDEVVKAQLVGVVYLQPAPDKDNYVHIGDHVKQGQTICVIEAMKMLTEVKSDYSGTIVTIDVNNEEMVDYDQPLLTIHPD